jgi:hypothetical protein
MQGGVGQYYSVGSPSESGWTDDPRNLFPHRLALNPDRQASLFPMLLTLNILEFPSSATHLLTLRVLLRFRSAISFWNSSIMI